MEVHVGYFPILWQIIAVNGSGLHKHHLQTPRIARHVRLVFDKGIGDRWCLKVEIHGCSWINHGKKPSTHSLVIRLTSTNIEGTEGPQ